MRLRPIVAGFGLIVAGVSISVALLGAPAGPAAATGNSITSPDTAGSVGSYTSLALDGAGNPVVGYYDGDHGDLKVMHCNDPNCAGGDESITSPDTAGAVGSDLSMELDGSGNPVVSYLNFGAGLKLMHCNDPNCTGGDESITSPDTAGLVGLNTSLELDGGGNPVIAYNDTPEGHLYVMHCNDPNCAGGNDTITPLGVGRAPSLQLDGSGNPVISDSYNVEFANVIEIIHCANPDCTGGHAANVVEGPNVYLDSESSLVLDGAGNPVVTYSGKLAHCNDPNCAGGDESVTTPGVTGGDGSLALDGFGNPVVAGRGHDLKVLHCNDPNCAGGDETITLPDTTGGVLGFGFTSIALDASGDPVVSYYDGDNLDLKLVHCGDPGCTGVKPTTATATATATRTSTGTPQTSTTASATPTASPTQTPTQTAMPGDTATPAPGETPQPTSTPPPIATLTPTPTRTPTQPATPTRTRTPAPAGSNGDVNCSGRADAVDAALVLQLGAGLIGSLSCAQYADVNHSGRVDPVDAALILQYSAGIIHSLPA